MTDPRCPVCGRPMERQPNALITSCDHCSFSVSELEACHLGARTPQEAADLKYHYLLAQGWSHDDGKN